GAQRAGRMRAANGAPGPAQARAGAAQARCGRTRRRASCRRTGGSPGTEVLMSLFYAGGIDVPMRQARAVQTLHTARALAAHGCRVTLAAARTPRRGLVDALAGYGLSPHPNLTILSLPTVRLPELPLAALAHPRLAVRNWS